MKLTSRVVICHDGTIVNETESIVLKMGIRRNRMPDSRERRVRTRQVELKCVVAPLDRDGHIQKVTNILLSTVIIMSDPPHRPSLKINAANHIATPIPPLLQQRMAAFANRTGAPPPTAADFNTKRTIDQAGDALRRANLASHPVLHPSQSFPRQKPTSLAAKRMKPDLNLASIDPKLVADDTSASFAGLGLGRPLDSVPKRSSLNLGTPFSNFSKIVYVVCSGSHPSFANFTSKSDTSGALNFEGKAILHASGVNFLNGKSFAIAMDDLILDEELGRGNYGTVKKVVHKPTKVAMAMKVIQSSFYLLSCFDLNFPRK